LRRIISVDTLTGPRFATALELLNEGGGFRFDGVIFRFEPAGVLRCIVESSWSRESVSRATAEEDIAFAEAVLRKVRSASPEFAASTADKTYRFELIYDDGGSSFLLAWREGDQLMMAARYGGGRLTCRCA
jgi:hypothetical protein